MDLGEIMNDTIVNILGTKYTIKLEELKNADYDGLCDPYSKIITIRSDNVNDISNFEFVQKLSTRHEIIHAFMFESGLGHNWEHKPIGHEETTVDWFAYQFPNILKVFYELHIDSF